MSRNPGGAGRGRAPDRTAVRGARVHNLKDVDVDVPLNEFVGIAGVSGSGKSSLALGVLYAEGSRRYMDALSTYTRRRIGQASRAQVDEVRHVPAALALRQRPAVPGVRSTFGTATELLNHLRPLFSRTGAYTCPHCGAEVPPGMNEARMVPYTCPACGTAFDGLGAEQLAFNSEGACPTCGGTGVTRVVDESTLVPDESISIDDGAVAPWGTLMWDLMKQVCGACGVRTDVPFNRLTQEERDIVLHGPAEKRHILYRAKKGDTFAEIDFTYYNAVRTVENALSKVKDEKGMRRVEKFLTVGPCADCGGTRLNERARSMTVRGIDLAQATALTLDELADWVRGVPASLPDEVRPMAVAILDEMTEPMERLQQLGLGYLSLDRAGVTLSTGELQRVQLSRAVRNRTTGVLYVLDEPSIGLHPANVDGLLGVVDDLLADGNSVVVVDHDVRVLRRADHLIEVGPASGADGGRIIAQGTVAEVGRNPASRIAPFLTGERTVRVRSRVPTAEMFAAGSIDLITGPLHTVGPLEVRIPRGRLTAVTGVSGSGKTTLVLESLVPALKASAAGEPLPAHVRSVAADGIGRARIIDAAPIGVNVRSTVATYSGVLDELRRAFARTEGARARGLRAGDFSYNTGALRCPTCDGTGTITLDVQFLPDVDVPCPDCGGARYAEEAGRVRRPVKRAKDAATGAPGSRARAVPEAVSLPELMACTVDQALVLTRGMRTVTARLRTLHDLGLGYLTLGEATPALSGGEAQRLKLAGELGRRQDDALLVFDEPTIGLHPLDVGTLLGVLDGLARNGATVVVVEHDLDVIADADWVVDMGPGGGGAGGAVVCAGTPEDVAANPASVTGRYLGQEL